MCILQNQKVTYRVKNNLLRYKLWCELSYTIQNKIKIFLACFDQNIRNKIIKCIA